MSTDVPELDMSAHIANRRADVSVKLAVCREHLARARELWARAQCPENRTYLVKAMAATEVMEAKQEALDVEFV